MTNAYIVTGLGYGDESKGSVVDYLSRQAPTVVVRHNGGPQAGHNVVTANGQHHCFSQFGAGSLAGAATFLSRFMLINPLNQLLEARHLMELEPEIWARTFVDENALVITPFHVAVNRLLETARTTRGVPRHGSCGQGVGAAAGHAISHPDLALRVKHLRLGGLPERLETLRRALLTAAPWRTGDPNEEFLADDDSAIYLARRYQEWELLANIVPSNHLAAMITDHEQVVFEGAQGVLLDQDYGWHPYTTWSNTTDENALTLIREAGNKASGDGQTSGDTQRVIAVPGHFDVIRLGVIRAVTTRHGPGPHPTEDPALTQWWAESHNSDGPWQGPFRVGHLDLMAHNYAVRVCGGVDQVVVTHLDRSQRWKYCDGYEGYSRIPLGRRGDHDRQQEVTENLMKVERVYLHDADEDQLLGAVERALGAPIGIRSYGATAQDKRQEVKVCK